MSDAGTPTRGIDRLASELAVCLPALHRTLRRRVAAAPGHPKRPEGRLPWPPGSPKPAK
ncbi:hypothetical protein ACIBVL_42395 [Streptomyces sp. NPDC049687]|uniref:hypothetical protein n=1 Tax=Streptomyces sp. NPDC049687 TaxID=3365596 RepID=UPI00378BAF73